MAFTERALLFSTGKIAEESKRKQNNEKEMRRMLEDSSKNPDSVW